jgi:hypothetical protein
MEVPHYQSPTSLQEGRDLACRVCELIWNRVNEEQPEYNQYKLDETYKISDASLLRL